MHIAAKGEDFRLHRDSFWELMYIRSGHIVCQQGADRYPLHTSMAILHPPQMPHADIASTAYQTYYLWLDAPESTRWPKLVYDDEYLSLERVCRSIFQEWHGKKPGRDEMLTLLGAQLLLLLRRAAEGAGRCPAEMVTAAAEQIMEADYHGALTVAEIAQRVGVSTSSLYEHFTRFRGSTPMEYLQAVRLRHALAHLYHSTRTLDVIAELCGYHSASHLSRHIKAATGESPGRLRSGTIHSAL